MFPRPRGWDADKDDDDDDDDDDDERAKKYHPELVALRE
jgi:hypothetical protein